MSTNLRAAAERLADDDPDYDVKYRDFDPYVDAKLVATALLTMLPPADDAELLTPDWLQSHFRAAGARLENGEEVLSLNQEMTRLSCAVGRDGRISRWFCNGSRLLSRPQTRGDVRRLCLVLGLPLEENDNG